MCSFHPLPTPGKGKGTLQLPTPLPGSRPLAQGILQEMRRKNRALPAAMCWPSATKVILYLRKGEGYEKNFPLQGFTFGGKMPGLAGSYQGGLSQKSLCSPHQCRQWYRKKLSFQQKIKRASQPGWLVSLWLGVGGGVWGWTPLQPQVLAGLLEEAAASFPGADGTAGSGGRETPRQDDSCCH